MKIIISGLLIVLAFSSYMALTTDYRIKAVQLSAPPKYETAEYAMPPAPPIAPLPAMAEIRPEPQQEVIYVSTIDEEDLDAEEVEEDWKDKPKETYPKYASNNSIEQEIVEVFGAESRIALAVAKAESGLNPRAINRNRDGSRDIGIFQINDRHGWEDEELLDWRGNIRIAKELRDRRGWGEWVVYNNGTYRNFL